MYTKEYFDNTLDRRGTNTYKWDWAQDTYGKDALPFFVADMDFRSVPEISHKLIERAKHNTFGYTRLSDAHYAALINFVKRHHDISIQKEQITTLPSVVTGLKLVIRCFTEKGQGVIIQTPVYGQFFKSISSNQRNIIENPLVLDANHRYSMDLNLLESLFKEGHRLLILCNPHNPVSRPWTKQELIDLLQIAQKYNVLVCSDEIHADFVYAPNQFISILPLAEEMGYENVCSLYAASKTFNVAGMQLAYLFSKNNTIQKKLQEEKEACGIESGNIFGAIASETAFAYGDEWLTGLLSYLDSSRKILSKALSTIPQIKLSPIEATYLAWMDLRNLGLSAKELTERCLVNGLIFTEGALFDGAKGEGFLRFNFACPHTQLEEGIFRLYKALK